MFVSAVCANYVVLKLLSVHQFKVYVAVILIIYMVPTTNVEKIERPLFNL